MSIKNLEKQLDKATLKRIKVDKETYRILKEENIKGYKKVL